MRIQTNGIFGSTEIKTEEPTRIVPIDSDIVALRAEIDRMKVVVEAAQKWRHDMTHKTDLTLVLAVEAYESTLAIQPEVEEGK